MKINNYNYNKLNVAGLNIAGKNDSSSSTINADNTVIIYNTTKAIKTVVVDIDGVVQDICGVMQQKVNEQGYPLFSMSRVLTYDFNKSLRLEDVPTSLIQTAISGIPYWLNAPRDLIYRELGNPDLFKIAKIPDCIVDMLKIMCLEPSIRLTFSTLSYRKEVAEVKRKRIQKLLQGYEYEYIDFIGEDKGVVSDADYIIEDSIDNLDNYTMPSIKKYLVDRVYNRERFNSSKTGFNDITRKITTYEALYSALADIVTDEVATRRVTEYAEKARGIANLPRVQFMQPVLQSADV